MAAMIWPGALVTLLGLCGLIYCVVSVAQAKKKNLSEEDMKSHLQKIVALNMGALFLSVVGLMMVVVGILLG